MSRFTPISTGSIRLDNRLVVPPMASQTASIDGMATKATIEHYDRLARSGAGLVMVEYSYIHPSGRSESHQLGAHSDECIEGMRDIAKAIHTHGAKAGFQLTHCGGKAQLDVCPGLMAPSGITVPAYDRTLPTPKAMTAEDIISWREAFMQAAIRAAEAGFDFVELHCAHGYGLNQVLSPITNQRKDQYGGTIANRARLIVEIIRRIKQTAQIGVMVRIPGQDLYPEGLTQKDMVQVCRLFVEAGVDIIDVSSGIGGWNRPKDRRGEGYLVAEAAYLKRCGLNVPIIGVGGIETPEFIEQALSEQWLDMAAVGRAILASPQDFFDNVMSQTMPA
ncbi:NADH:flavin oxidoreductase [Photobacterium rosenbergii]|uniref:NADH:flavin oxidoreductase n=1 Tax=Photobacterium rosenbergii TaxID=294936 RepID=A0ABU3ZJG1_9GAMM|nr:NADH:flavin oxidoreductase [Photobacterium rosenbergii]MDV5170123.1 NADH:flavin oxidoreductase [Photobacterium rosenbergii]